MNEIAAEAEKVGLIDARSLPRRDSARDFVMDLWTENPVTLDRLNLRQDYLNSPQHIEDLADIFDVLL